MPKPSMRRSIAIASDPSATAGLTPTLCQRGSVIRVGSFAGSESVTSVRTNRCPLAVCKRFGPATPSIWKRAVPSYRCTCPRPAQARRVGAVAGTVLKGQPLPRGLGRDAHPGASPLGCRSRLELMAELMALMARAAPSNALARRRDTNVCRKILSRSLKTFAENVP